MPICATCRSIDLQKIIEAYRFSNFTPEGRRTTGRTFPHHQTYRDLRSSAASCQCCALFYEESNADSNYPNKPPIHDFDVVRLRARTSRDGWPERYIVRGQEVGLLALTVEVGKADSNIVSYYKNVEIWVDNDAPLVLRRAILTRPVQSLNDFSVATKWLRDCLSSHRSCRKAGQTSPAEESSTLPSRVVDVNEGSANDEARVVETSGQKGIYIALSHCWGSEPVSTTKTSTLSHNKTGMKLAELSANFRDAILVTRSLGFQYLWIDSLCIIQDSVEDWEIESSKMAEIYQNAVLTLSAANSKGATEGFLKPPQDRKDISAAIPNINGPGTFYLGGTLCSSYADDIDGGPLNSRGWTLQERIFSRRNLFFGRDQCHWECKTAQYSETTPESLQKATDIAAGVSSLQDLQSMARTETDRPKLFTMWYNLIRQFTLRSLTVSDDRLPALSGIARTYNTILGGQQTYLAGLWQEDIIRGLLWKNFGPNVKAQQKYRCPSWSWSSMDGPVHFEEALDAQVADLMAIDFTISKSRDTFGRVTSARLTATGRIGVVPHVVRMGPHFQAGDRGFYVLTNAVLKTEQGKEFGAGYLDNPNMKLTEGIIYCLAVRHPGRVGLGQMRVDALLLTKASNIGEEYVRIGTATLSAMGGSIDQLLAPFQVFLANAKEQRIVII